MMEAYLRNSAFKKDGVDYHVATDLTGQANHLTVTIEADIVKQKQAENNGGFTALNFGKTHKKVYSELTRSHPIDLTRWQVVNCYLGRAGLINSGGAAGENDLAQAVRTAVINKRAGGVGLISGRKALSARCRRARSCFMPSRTCILRKMSRSRDLTYVQHGRCLCRFRCR